MRPNHKKTLKKQKMLVFKDKQIPVTDTGLLCPINLIAAFTGKDRNKAAKAVREFQDSKTWLDRTYHKIDFTITENNKKMVNLKQALSMIEYFPCRTDDDTRLHLIRVLKEYIKANPALNIPDLKWNPEWKQAKEEQRVKALQKKTICPIHKKAANTCLGCLDLHKQDPNTHPCPKAICPKHFQCLSRCKGCNKKYENLICKFHGKRKSVCKECLSLYKAEPKYFKCPKGMCRLHKWRKSRCHCKEEDMV